jgi:hypothetical protein
LTSAFSVAVSRGLIGAVSWRSPGPLPAFSALSSVTLCAVFVWLVTISEIGPAPKRCGETDTRWSSMDAVRTMGLGGRGSFL